MTFSKMEGRRYGLLLFSILLLPLAAPYLPGRVVPVLVVLVLLGVVRVAAGDRRLFRWAAALALLPILAAVARLVTGEVSSIWWLSQSSALLFLLLAALSILADVMSDGLPMGDRLRGAVCVYFLAALVWSLLYAVVAELDPAAFAPPQPAREVAPHLYFSLVTLTTLGYGDVTPVAPIARQLVVFEAVFGQFYLAILVARLVALSIAPRSDGPPGG